MVKTKAYDTYSYKGWLTSDHFHRRAMAVLGYDTVASLGILAVMLAIMIIFGLW